MSVLVGQVYYPRFKEEEKDGSMKTSFTFSLATRKAFVDDATKPNLFTHCVTYQPGLAKVLKENFGKDEHRGKAIVVYGHYNEFEWYPDPNNNEHDKYFQPFTITSDILAQGGVKLAEGSAQEVTIQVPMKQTTRQFVITGFEFADSSQATSSTPRASSAPPIKIGGVSASAGNTDGNPLPASDGNVPF
jgi:hypothetical protein